MSCIQRFSVEHGKFVHGKVQEHVWHLLRDLAQAEERGYGGQVQQKGEARMAVCSRRTSTHQRECKQCGLQTHVGWSLIGD